MGVGSLVCGGRTCGRAALEGAGSVRRSRVRRRRRPGRDRRPPTGRRRCSSTCTAGP